MTWCPWWGGASANLGSGTLGAWGVMGLITNVLFFLLIVIGSVLMIWWLTRSLRQTAPVGLGSNRGMEILKERYARGEISLEQLGKMSKEIVG